MSKKPKTANPPTASTDVAKQTTAETPSTQPLTTQLQNIRTDALRDRSHTGSIIAKLQAQREQLEEMRNEIDATVAFLRAQRNK